MLKNEEYIILISKKIAELNEIIVTIKTIHFHLKEEDILLDSLEKLKILLEKI